MDRKVAMVAGATIGSMSALFYAYCATRNFLQRRRLLVIARKHCEDCRRSIEELRQSLKTGSDDVLMQRSRIVSLSINDLLSALQTDKLTAVEVMEAYQWQSIAANDTTNCLCCLFPNARHKALALDQRYGGKPNKPPLFGIPFSVKECVQVDGYPSTRGYIHHLADISNIDAVIVAHLESLGAIPFCHTNVPQSLLSFVCANPIYGRTSHPMSQKLVPGGSSGGEAALLAMHGSVLGIGSDVGGSIRMPAHFCGITGIKPTKARLAQKGLIASIPGRPMVEASVGPMARDVDGLALFFTYSLTKSLFNMDACVAPVPFDQDVYKSSEALRIGWYETDGYFEPVPACRRAVHVARAALIAAGHTLVPFTPPNVWEAMSCFYAAIAIDGGQYVTDELSEDIVEPLFRDSYKLIGIPLRIRRWLSYLLSSFRPRLAHLLGSFVLDTSEARKAYERLEIYRVAYETSWKAVGLDALICPAHVCTAVPHEYPAKLIPTCSYTMLYNALDFPAGVVPCTKVTAEDEVALDSYNAVDSYEKLALAAVKGGVGLPVGVQCVALPFREEICLRVMKEIETHCSSLK